MAVDYIKPYYSIIPLNWATELARGPGPVHSYVHSFTFLDKRWSFTRTNFTVFNFLVLNWFLKFVWNIILIMTSTAVMLQDFLFDLFVSFWAILLNNIQISCWICNVTVNMNYSFLLICLFSVFLVTVLYDFTMNFE